MERNRNIPVSPGLCLDDLRAWHIVLAHCARCAQQTEIPIIVLTHNRSPVTRLAKLQRRLRCTRCGNRRGNWFEIIAASRNI